MCARYGHTRSRYSSARPSLLQLSFWLLVLLLLITPTLTAQESQSENDFVKIEKWRLMRATRLSLTLEARLTQRVEQVGTLQKRVTSLLTAFEGISNSRQSFADSWWRERQAWDRERMAANRRETELREERDSEAQARVQAEARAHRRGIAFIVAAILAAAEGAILIAQ